MELAVYGFCGLVGVSLNMLSVGDAVVLVIVAFIIIRFLITLGSFLLAWRYRAPRPSEARISLLQILRLILFEWLALNVLYIFLQPWEAFINRRLNKRIRKDHDTRAQMPVLLVHGFFCNGAFWWAFRRSLSAHGWSRHYTINLEPVFAGIDGYAAQIADRVEYIRHDADADQVILIAHSMGGLACRRYLENLGDNAPVSKLVTLGSPHHGTQLAKLLPTTNVCQMRPNSDWLRVLNQQEIGAVPITSIYSWHDNVIAPQDNSHLVDAENRAVAGIGHLAMAFSKRIHGLVLQQMTSTIF